MVFWGERLIWKVEFFVNVCVYVWERGISGVIYIFRFLINRITIQLKEIEKNNFKGILVILGGV